MGDDVYRVKQPNKLLLIVNFANHPDPKRSLPGYKIDEENIKKTFKAFNFAVTVKHEVKGKEILKEVESYLEANDFSKDDCTAFAICTHGTDYDNLCGEDEKTVNLNAIVNEFADGKRGFVGKPKLFFIQACRGDDGSDTSEVKSASSAPKKVEFSDCFIFHPTFPGKVSYVHDTKGSYFIETLCNILNEGGGRSDLLQIATKVNKVLSEKVTGFKSQMSECRFSLTWTVYLTNVESNSASNTNGHMLDCSPSASKVENDNSASPSAPNVEKTPVEGPLLTDLKDRHIKKLNKLNETITSTKNWRHLADEIFKGEEEQRNIRNLKLKYIGDSVGKGLLDALKSTKPDLTVDDFKEVATNLEREDIVKIFEGIDATLMSEIDSKAKDVYENLILKLELTPVGNNAIENWRGFCNELDIDQQELNHTVRPEGNPIKELIDIIKVRKAEYPLSNLKDALKSIGRDADARTVEKIIAELAKKK